MTHKWYEYKVVWGNRERRIMRPMTAAQAEVMGAVELPDFDPDQRLVDALGECLIVTFPPDGVLERRFSVTAEISANAAR